MPRNACMRHVAVMQGVYVPKPERNRCPTGSCGRDDAVSVSCNRTPFRGVSLFLGWTQCRSGSVSDVTQGPLVRVSDRPPRISINMIAQPLLSDTLASFFFPLYTFTTQQSSIYSKQVSFPQ